MTYLAVFEGKSGHFVDRDALTRALRSDWPDVHVSVTHADAPGREVRDVVWTYREDGRELEGGSHVDGTCLYLDGPFGLAVRFAVWYRALVSPAEELVFCDDSYSFDVPVPAGARPLQLDDLRSWYVRLRDGVDASAFAVGWQGPVSGRDKLSASLHIEGPQRLGGLTVWETGEAQLQLGDLGTGLVDDHTLRTADTAALAVAVSIMRQWAEGAPV